VQGYEPGSQQLRISKIIVHKQYSSRSYLNDIALLKVKDQIVMSNTVRRVCMPLKDVAVGKSCVVTGWGLTESGSTSKYLRQVYMSIVEPSYCVSKYQKTVVKITDNQLCAGADKGAKDSCSGDSGGPLVCRTDSTWHLNGIVSVGPKKCATEGVPGVYTKVTNYIHWIKENSGVQ
jgi:secreted trypsin-like serine protease